MPTIHIIGAGISGLSSALTSCSTDPSTTITIYEFRPLHKTFIRPGFFVLTPYTLGQLSTWGVLQDLQERGLVAPYERFNDGVIGHEKDSEMMKRYEGVTGKEVVDVMIRRREGVWLVGIRDLHTALYRAVLKRSNIQIQFSSTVRLVPSPTTSESKYTLEINGQLSQTIPDLIILAEGSRRRLLSSLGIKTIQKTDVQYHVLVALSQQIPPGIYLNDTPGSRDRFLAFGNVAMKGDRTNDVPGLDTPRDSMLDGLTLTFVDVPKRLLASSSEARDELEVLVKTKVPNYLNVFSGFEKKITSDDVAFVGPAFKVKETIVEKCFVGGNVVVVGDAGRTGHYFGGLG